MTKAEIRQSNPGLRLHTFRLNLTWIYYGWGILSIKSHVGGNEDWGLWCDNHGTVMWCLGHPTTSDKMSTTLELNFVRLVWPVLHHHTFCSHDWPSCQSTRKGMNIRLKLVVLPVSYSFEHHDCFIWKRERGKCCAVWFGQRPLI